LEIAPVPTYVYEVIRDDKQPGERFEVVQAMSDEPLTHHPETGEPVQRVFLPTWIAGKNAPNRTERALRDDKKLERMGFTKYVKSGDGTYEKSLGSGPDLLKK
jgi:predicted nucleic acid-binding Zn ribbon protein